MNHSTGEATLSNLLAFGEDACLAITDVHGSGLTYAALRSQMQQTHRVLSRIGLRRDDTVATSLRNGPETAALFLALASYCRVAPLNPSYTVPEIVFALGDLEARAFIFTEDAREAANAAGQSGVQRIFLKRGHTPGAYELTTERGRIATFAASSPPPRPDDIALLLHTSGTTARPKLVPITHRSITLSARGVARVLELTQEDRCLAVMPLFHIHGLVGGLLASISAGATVCCAPGFQALSFFHWLDDSRATWYSAVPTIHQTILARMKYNQDVLRRHQLRLIRSSSAPLFPAVWKQLESAFGARVLNAYGMTEAAHQISSVPLRGDSRFHGTVGAATGPEVGIIDSNGTLLSSGVTGEVVLRGEQVMRGYLKPPEANKTVFTNGWFRTGDEGFLDSKGALTLTGRLKEMINSGGEKVSPYEVEEALLLHPAVSEAVAFAAPHALLGEEVAAAVVVHTGAQVSERDLLRSVRGRLARCKIPRQLLFLDEIPRGATGKLQRIGLAARLGLASS